MAKHVKGDMERIIRKVKNLLDLANNNPSQEEAIAASLKAQELIAKYNLDLTEEEKEELEIVQMEYVTGIDKSWKYNLASIVGKNFRVEHYWRRKKAVVFYGYKQDCEVAVKVFEYLFKVGERGARRECRKAYKEKGTEVGVYYSYTRGFLQGIQNKMEVQCTALMIVTPKEVSTAFEEYCEEIGMGFIGKYRTGAEDGISKTIYKMGVREGEQAMSTKPVESTPETKSNRITSN